MTYDDGLAHRVRQALGPRHDLDEREMFGGLAFVLDGNMVCGVLDESLVARVGPEEYDDALSEPHARPFDFTGRAMRGWVYVDPPGLTSDEALEDWLDRSLGFVESLPPK